MQPGGSSEEPEDISERVARGFEALVAEEPPMPVTGHERAAPAAPSSQGPPGPDVAALEARVRHTMDRVTELVEAQLPEAVDGLRSDLETLRLELQTSLTYASEQLAEERRQLRAEIAATVGAANRWFVRTRDQLYERLDRIGDAAAAASEQAEIAAAAAIAPPALAAVPPPAELAPGPSEERPAAEDGDGEQPDFEWDVRDGAPVAAEEAERAERAVANGTPPGSAVQPLRDDIQELQGEVAAMGEVLVALREDLELLRRRIPARPRPVHLDPADIELIVTAVMMANPPPPEPEPAPAAPARAPRKAVRKAAKKSPAKRTPRA